MINIGRGIPCFQNDALYSKVVQHKFWYQFLENPDTGNATVSVNQGGEWRHHILNRLVFILFLSAIVS